MALTATWSWTDAAYEALADGRVDLRRGGTAMLVSADPVDGTEPAVDGVKGQTLRGVRVTRDGALTRWAFEDLQFGPGATADGIRGVVVRQGDVPLAVLPFGRSLDVVDGVLTVVVDTEAVLTLGNRR
jgi:hypothetical protein